MFQLLRMSFCVAANPVASFLSPSHIPMPLSLGIRLDWSDRSLVSVSDTSGFEFNLLLVRNFRILWKSFYIAFLYVDKAYE